MAVLLDFLHVFADLQGLIEVVLQIVDQHGVEAVSVEQIVSILVFLDSLLFNLFLDVDDAISFVYLFTDNELLGQGNNGIYQDVNVVIVDLEFLFEKECCNFQEFGVILLINNEEKLGYSWNFLFISHEANKVGC